MPALSTRLRRLYSAAGARFVDVPVLHPADPFLETAGEDIRKRMFVTEGSQGERLDLAALVAGARSDGDNLAFLGLFLGGVRNDDAALGPLLGFKAADDDTVVQWPKLHGFPLSQRGDSPSENGLLALVEHEC